MSNNTTERRVWDLPVRVFHWALAICVAGAYITNQMGIEYFVYHLWFGYSVLVLVCFRLIWGLIGTRHARFWNFLRGPVTTARYALDILRGQAPPSVGHNPLGAWMVIVMLLALLVQATLGLFGNDEIFNVGPLVGYVSTELSLKLTSLHRELFYWILGAIVLHVAAVLYHRLRHGEKLVRAMFTGRKPGAVVPESEAISSSRTLLALIITALLVAVLVWVVKHAPQAQEFMSFD